MIYALFSYLAAHYDLIGVGLFRYISFRSGLAFVTSILFMAVFTKYFIAYLRKRLVYENVRDLNLGDENLKNKAVPMGGVVMIGSILTSTLFYCDLTNIYIISLIVCMLWMGGIGFWDDYIKNIKHNKSGLSPKSKLLAQLALGLFIAGVVYYHPDAALPSEQSHALLTSVPFVKSVLWDYAHFSATPWISLVFFAFVLTFIIMGVSNGANLTDGLDGLAAGSSAIIVGVLSIFCWVSSHQAAASYLDILHIPKVGEAVIFCAAFSGSLLGFLWYNTNPATIFMGDTGSLCIGALVASLAIFLRKELFLPLICGIYFVESLSTILQVSWFKYTRWRTGVGRRIFKMAPLHHHYQKIGISERKIVARFWIVGMLLAIASLLLLKVR